MNDLRERFAGFGIGLLLTGLLVICVGFGIYWSRAPEALTVPAEKTVGATTVTTLIQVADTLLEKPGGYLSNDIFVPGVLLDNMPSFEHGVLIQVRDLTRALRRHMSRSQTQSVEDVDLIVAEPKFNYDSERWWLPSAESQYRDGIDALQSYRQRLLSGNGQFFARADNLRAWLEDVEKSLGSFSQRLTASVGQRRFNIDWAGDAGSQQAAQQVPVEIEAKTPWLLLDDVFFEARGASWALLHLLQAIEIDFAQVLQKKNAAVSFKQIIRELEGTQETLWSPMVLNGDGFGFLANHSLVLASYISRANSAVIDLRELLAQG